MSDASESMQQRLARLEKEIKETKISIANQNSNLFHSVRNPYINKWVLLNEKEYNSYQEIGEQLYFR